jgi:hypothetical protein
VASILKLVIGAVLRFFWDRAEDWYQQELRYQRNKRILIEEVKDVARKAADANEDIAFDRESVDDSLLRLERVVQRTQSIASDPLSIGQPLFGAAYLNGTCRDSSGDSGELPEISVSDVGSDSDNPESERPGTERVGAGSYDSLPPA